MRKFNEYMRKKVIFSYEIGMACNLRCDYCYNLKSLDNKKTHDDEVAGLVIKNLKKFKNENPDYELELDILGGEPLMSPNLFDFIKELSEMDIIIWVVTNLLPDTKEKLVKLRSLIELPNVAVSATWHNDINDDQFKENLMFMRQSMSHRNYDIKENGVNTNLMASFILFNDNDHITKKCEWLTKNDIQYTTTQCYTDGERVEKYIEYTDDVKKCLNGSVSGNYDFFLDDTKMSTEEFEVSGMYRVAEKHRVICEPLNYNIEYNGNVHLSCKKVRRNNHDYPITEGIKPIRIYCEGGDCYCSFYGYKEIHGKK